MKVENGLMKRQLAYCFVLYLCVEFLTSLWIWQNQPSHGLVDVYGYSFLSYASERLAPWVVIASIMLAFVLFVPRVFRSRR